MTQNSGKIILFKGRLIKGQSQFVHLKNIDMKNFNGKKGPV
jgi:hypothetical protein